MRLPQAILLIIFTSPIFAQGETYKYIYGTSAVDEAHFVEPLPDGGYIIAGRSAQNGLLARFNSDGTPVWVRTIGGSGSDIFKRLILCTDGNLLAFGETSSFGSGADDFFMVKFSQNGDILWQRTSGGASNELARGLAEVADGYVICGATLSYGQGFWDIYIEKLDFNGNTQWNHVFGTSQGDMAGGVVAGQNGEIWMSAFKNIIGNDHDLVLYRFSSNGAILENTSYPVTGNYSFYSLNTLDNQLLAGGHCWTGGPRHPILVRFNTNGTVNWARRYPLPGGNYLAHMGLLPDGSVIFAAENTSTDAEEALLIKTNPSGAISWAKTYSYEGNTGNVIHARVLADGGFIAVGYINNSGRNLLIIKTDADGEIEYCCPSDYGAASAISVFPGMQNSPLLQTSGAGLIPSSLPNSTIALTPDDLCTEFTCCIPPEMPDIASDTLTCLFTEVELDASSVDYAPGFQLQWSGPGILSGTDSTHVLVNQPGTYTFVVSGSDPSCTDSVTVTVVDLTELPAVQLNSDGPINCVQSSVTLSAQGLEIGTDYELNWSFEGDPVPSWTDSLEVLAQDTGTYSVIVTNTFTGCSGSASVLVFQNFDLPEFTLNPPDTLSCLNPQVVLSAQNSSGTAYTYSWSSIDGNIISGAQSPNPSVNQAGWYFVELTNTLSECTDTASILVLIDTSTIAFNILEADSVSCYQPSISLEAQITDPIPGYSILWTTTSGLILEGGTSLTPTVSQPGSYMAAATHPSSGCVSQLEIVVPGDISLPELFIAIPDTLTCANTNTLLDATGSLAGSSYVANWLTGNGLLGNGSNSLLAEALQPGTYTLSLLNLDNGCENSSEVEVFQDITPPLVFAGAPFIAPCIDTFILASPTVTQAGSSPQFQWSVIEGSINGDLQVLAPAIQTPGIYELTVINSENGCSSSDVLVVQSIDDIPWFATLAAWQPACPGDPGSIYLEQITGGTPPYQASYFDADGMELDTSAINTLQEGTYTVLVVDAYGCETSTEVVVSAPFVPDLELDSLVFLDYGELYQMQPQINLPDSALVQIQWTPSVYLSCDDCLFPIATPFTSTLYTLELITDRGCLLEADIQLLVDSSPSIYIPNVFSPNGDGFNDFFTVYSKQGHIRSIRRLSVFGRWGELVYDQSNFQPNNELMGWDGRHRGRMMNPGVFAWLAELELLDGRVLVLKGDLTLLR